MSVEANRTAGYTHLRRRLALIRALEYGSLLKCSTSADQVSTALSGGSVDFLEDRLFECSVTLLLVLYFVAISFHT